MLKTGFQKAAICLRHQFFPKILRLPAHLHLRLFEKTMMCIDLPHHVKPNITAMWTKYVRMFRPCFRSRNTVADCIQEPV
jgi:hypothetical protein